MGIPKKSQFPGPKGEFPDGEYATKVMAKGGKKRMKVKLENRGNFFFGYAKEHAGDVYRMINVQTKKVTETRNVIFVVKNFR